MISFSLVCDNGHEFDGWFQSGAAFEEQASAGRLACPVCASPKVSKGLMAPNVGTRSNREGEVEQKAPPAFAAAGDDKTRELAENVRRLRKHITETAEYVGERFPEEARKIHYEEAEKRGIFGEASVKEARDLVEEGVEVMPIPQLPEDHN